MNFRYKKQLAFFFGLISVLASCKITKSYKAPDIQTKNLFRDPLTADTATLASKQWQSLFSDTVLTGLITEGLNRNLNLQTAIQQMVIAEATLRQSRAAFFPTLDGSATVTRSKSSQASLNFPAGISINTLTTSYQAGLTTSWEADIWGKLRSAKRAALASYLSSDAAKRAVQTQLIADIANSYFNLLALDRQLEITEQTLQNRIKDVETVKTLKEGAVVTGAAVVQSEANRYATEVSIPDLKQSIREAENALNVLLAREPGPIRREKLANQQPITDLQTGIPLQLLVNRPDVQQAEYNFRYAFENTNLARTYFYPALTVTAGGGLSSLQLKNFFDKSIFYNLAGGLTQPIFNQGLNKARLITAKAQQQQALNDFQLQLLTAGQEVSNALYAYQAAVQKQVTRAKQLEALQKAVDYTEELLRYSSATNYTDVLTSQQSLLAAQLSSINDRLQQLQAGVNLYRALGGGWKQ